MYKYSQHKASNNIKQENQTTKHPFYDQTTSPTVKATRAVERAETAITWDFISAATIPTATLPCLVPLLFLHYEDDPLQNRYCK